MGYLRQSLSYMMFFNWFCLVLMLNFVLFLFWKTSQALFNSFPFSNSAPAGPQPGMKKEEGLNNTEHTRKSQKLSL